MDFDIGIKKLPPPNNIQISYPKVAGNSIVTWNNVPTSDGINNIMYNIYRGISANGIFYKLNNEPLIENRYEDKDVGHNPNTVYWYKLSSVYQKDSNFVEGPLSSPVIYRVLNTNRWFNKMNERNLWILKNTGQLFDLYTRKYEGKICNACYDSARGRGGIGPDCKVCFGTGFEGGYEPMFQLYVRQKPAQTDLALSTHGFTYNHTPGAWTISTVAIKNRDLLINPQGVIFSVVNQNINQAAGYLFHQELQLKELDPTDALYKMKRATLYPNL